MTHRTLPSSLLVLACSCLGASAQPRTGAPAALPMAPTPVAPAAAALQGPALLPPSLMSAPGVAPLSLTPDHPTAPGLERPDPLIPPPLGEAPRKLATAKAAAATPAGRLDIGPAAPEGGAAARPSGEGLDGIVRSAAAGDVDAADRSSDWVFDAAHASLDPALGLLLRDGKVIADGRNLLAAPLSRQGEQPAESARPGPPSPALERARAAASLGIELVKPGLLLAAGFGLGLAGFTTVLLLTTLLAHGSFPDSLRSVSDSTSLSLLALLPSLGAAALGMPAGMGWRGRFEAAGLAYILPFLSTGFWALIAYGATSLLGLAIPDLSVLLWGAIGASVVDLWLSRWKGRRSDGSKLG